AELAGNGVAGLLYAFGRHLDSVGTHIGDQTAFIETLGDLHGPGRRKTEAAGSVLLQGRSGERGVWVAFGRLFLDADDPEFAGFDRLLQVFSLRLVADVELVRLPAVDRIEARLERLVLF